MGNRLIPFFTGVDFGWVLRLGEASSFISTLKGLNAVFDS
jgi:hypothetical protein